MSTSNRFRPFALIAFAVAALPASLAACAADTSEDPAASSSSTESAYSQCPSYPRNPACDESFFLQKAWQMAKQDAWANGGAQVGNAGACITGLVAAGAVVGGTAEAPPVAVALGSVVGALGTIEACRAFTQYLNDTGLPANLSCFFQPVLNDKNVQLCECRAQCTEGSRNSGQFGDYSAPRPFRYGYLDRFGSANCYCTDDAKEARCQWSCENGWASPSVTDCTCR